MDHLKELARQLGITVSHLETCIAEGTLLATIKTAHRLYHDVTNFQVTQGSLGSFKIQYDRLHEKKAPRLGAKYGEPPKHKDRSHGQTIP